jgi:hypothetical protein
LQPAPTVIYFFCNMWCTHGHAASSPFPCGHAPLRGADTSPRVHKLQLREDLSAPASISVKHTSRRSASWAGARGPQVAFDGEHRERGAVCLKFWIDPGCHFAGIFSAGAVFKSVLHTTCLWSFVGYWRGPFTSQGLVPVDPSTQLMAFRRASTAARRVDVGSRRRPAAFIKADGPAGSWMMSPKRGNDDAVHGRLSATAVVASTRTLCHEAQLSRARLTLARPFSPPTAAEASFPSEGCLWLAFINAVCP